MTRKVNIFRLYVENNLFRLWRKESVVKCVGYVIKSQSESLIKNMRCVFEDVFKYWYVRYITSTKEILEKN